MGAQNLLNSFETLLKPMRETYITQHGKPVKVGKPCTIMCDLYKINNKESKIVICTYLNRQVALTIQNIPNNSKYARTKNC